MNKSNNRVQIKSPRFEELGYVKKLWADEETMRDVGGIIEFVPERHQSWYERMVKTR